MKLKFKKLEEWAKIPTPPREGDAGLDLFVSDKFPSFFMLNPGMMVMVDTGLAIELPEGTVGLVRPRSSAFKKGILVEGVIDSSYTGSAKLMIRNIGKDCVIIEPGKAYAQLVVLNYNQITELEEVTELKKTERGESGWGSTGNS